MGREIHEQADDVEVESYHPGCMGGMFNYNVLDYHHWYFVKKIFPHRKLNRGRKHARCCANPQTISMEREPVESQRLLDAEADQIRVQHQTRKTGSTNRRSGKEKAKEENKNWILGHSARSSQSQQIDATHHLEPSSFGLGWMNPIILVRKRGDNSDTSSTKSKKPDVHDRKNEDKHFEHGNDKRGTQALTNQKPMSKKLRKQVSYSQVEGVDVLEIFKVNEDLFLDILQDPEVGISQHFPGKKTSKAVKLTKSGSFPMPDSPRSGYLRSSTLEHKQKEVWSFRKGEKPVAGARLSKSKAVTKSEDRLRSIVKEEASSSSPGSDPQRWNHSVMNRLKDIKQRIKQALKERRKSNNHRMAKRLSSQVSTLSTNERDISESSEKTVDRCPQTNADDPDISNDRLKRMIRTKSINESLDRYTQLFQHSVSKEANLHHSKSLKLSNEDKVPSKGNAPPRFFRRISSLSDLESFCSLLYEVSFDALSSETPIRNIQDHDADKETDAHNEPKPISAPEDVDQFEVVEDVTEAELQEKTRGGSNNHDSSGLSVGKSGEQIAKPCEFNEDIDELTQATSELGDITSTAMLPMSEGLNHPNFSEGEETEFFTKERRKASRESVDYKTMGNSSRILFFEPDTEADDPWYNYVKDILELAGFTQNEGLETWFSRDQPLDPSMFKEMETVLHPELESTIDEIGGFCNHQVVFDLVDEALLEMGEKSSAYFPKPFSFNSGSRLLKRNNVVQEVWSKVSKNLDYEPVHDQSLDDIVARDLDKVSWMNHQAESEFVALELEDLVFEELLDEVLCLLDE